MEDLEDLVIIPVCSRGVYCYFDEQKENVWTYLDRVIMDIKTEANSLVECSHWFLRAVDVNGFFGLDIALLMVYNCLYHSISDSLKM